MDEILKRIGQLFVLGFSGEEPSTEFLDFVGEEQIGGVILFEANCPTYAAARESIRRITERLETQPFVALDQEGGRVRRSSAEDGGHLIGLAADRQCLEIVLHQAVAVLTAEPAIHVPACLPGRYPAPQCPARRTAT